MIVLCSSMYGDIVVFLTTFFDGFLITKTRKSVEFNCLFMLGFSLLAIKSRHEESVVPIG